jgi:hypothetical protein
MSSFKNIKASILSPIDITTMMGRHIAYPSEKFRTSNKFGTPGGMGLSLNSLMASASNKYLTGETY